MALKCFHGYLFSLMVFVIIVLLLFEFYVFLIISRDRRNMVAKKYIHDYETALCSFSVPSKPFQPSKAPCPSQGIVTMFRQGSLSSHMWLYANVFATSITTGLEAYIPICVQQLLSRVFDNLTIPLLAEIGHCFLPLPESVSNLEDWTPPSQSIVISGRDLCNDHVAQYLHLLRSHFVFNKKLENLALLHLLRAKGNASNATYIGVYITKTSIVVNQEYDDLYPSVQFFMDAMNHFRKGYSDAVFVVIVDKKSFWESLFDKRDVYIVEEMTLTTFGEALSVLAHCNHTILASDDFAVWGAILSGGSVIVSLCLSDDFSSLIQNYKTWSYLLNNTESVNKFLERLF